jgi:hypothetical protein
MPRPGSRHHHDDFTTAFSARQVRPDPGGSTDRDGSQIDKFRRETSVGVMVMEFTF